MAEMKQSTGTELSAEKIANYALQNPKYPEIELAQVAHRIRLIQEWSIPSGARVLELGCGQGNTTTVLAEAVGPSGHVDAVDPAPSDYGAPFTLAQAQAHISESEVGKRVKWHQADPVGFLQSTNDTWDYAVLSHCIWYFKSPETLKEILSALRPRVGKICIAEYALHASIPESVPHVVAALTRATLEAHKKDSTENIQSPLSPTGIREIAESAGLTVEHETNVVPEKELSDGGWEVGSVAHKGFLDEISQDFDARVALLLRSMRDSVVSTVARIGGAKKVRTMDVYVARYGS